MARDIIHEAVKQALINDGWTITDDPLIVAIEDSFPVEIDLGAEKVLGAERDGQYIAVEVKSFVKRSFIHEFHGAVGQYMNYKGAMEDSGINREMILAVSSEVYYKMEKIGFVRNRLEQFSIKLLVVDIQEKTIEKWIK